MVILVKFLEFLKITTKMSFSNITSLDFLKNKDYLKCMTKKAKPEYHQYFPEFVLVFYCYCNLKQHEFIII